MKLIQLKERTALDPKQQKKYQALDNLIDELNQKELSEDFVNEMNKEIDHLNAISSSEKSFSKEVRKLYNKLNSGAINKLKLVPKNYYMTLGMTVGMAAFGIPLGLIFSMSLDSFAFIGIGLPIGLGAGLAIGSGLDRKAEVEDRQLKTVSY